MDKIFAELKMIDLIWGLLLEAICLDAEHSPDGWVDRNPAFWRTITNIDYMTVEKTIGYLVYQKLLEEEGDMIRADLERIQQFVRMWDVNAGGWSGMVQPQFSTFLNNWRKSLG